MKLWIITYPEANWFADEMGTIIVRAEDEMQARLTASASHLAEGGKVWLLPEETSCEPLSNEGEDRIIVRA